MDEGVVERGEDTSNAEDELTCANGGVSSVPSLTASRYQLNLKGIARTLTGLGAQGDVLLGGADGLLGRHLG